MSIKLPEFADLEESEDPRYQQARDRDAGKKDGADQVQERHETLEKCVQGGSVTGEEEGE